MGFFGITVSNGIQFTGLQYSSVGNMTLISTTAPVITATLARFFLREKLDYLQISGIIISFFGTLYLFSEGNFSSFTHLQFNKGDIYFFLGEIAWVIYVLLSIPTLKKCQHYLLLHGLVFLVQFLRQSMHNVSQIFTL